MHFIALKLVDLFKLEITWLNQISSLKINSTNNNPAKPQILLIQLKYKQLNKSAIQNVFIHKSSLQMTMILNQILHKRREQSSWQIRLTVSIVLLSDVHTALDWICIANSIRMLLMTSVFLFVFVARINATHVWRSFFSEENSSGVPAAGEWSTAESKRGNTVDDSWRHR